MNILGRVAKGRALPIVHGPLSNMRYIVGSAPGSGGGIRLLIGQMPTEAAQLAAFSRLIRPGMVVLDIGANYGLYSMLASRLVGKEGCVVAFEPYLLVLQHLMRHVALNGLTNVRIVPAACSDECGVAAFQGDPHHHPTAKLSLAGDLLVPTVTVDAVVASGGLAPDLVKIDVEGAELSVLRGMKKLLGDRRPAIVLSTHHPELADKCLDMLKEYGYQAERLPGSHPLTAEWVLR